MPCINHQDASVYSSHGQRGCIECVESDLKPSKLYDLLVNFRYAANKKEEAEARTQILALIEEVISSDETTDYQDELAHDKFTRNDLRAEQRLRKDAL